MLTPSTPAAAPYETSNTARAATVEASARASYREENQAGVANEASVVRATQVAREAAIQVPDVMNSLSTVAVAGALNSLPAALNMMRNIVTASASGTLTEADRRTLHDGYAQLSQKVVSSVGSISAGAQAQSSTTQGDAGGNQAGTSSGERGDDHAARQRPGDGAVQPVQRDPAGRAGATPQAMPLAGRPAPRRDAPAALHTHELHVGADAYEAVPRHPAMAHPTPATSGHVEAPAAAPHVDVAQAARLTQFKQVAQAEPVPPAVGVA